MKYTKYQSFFRQCFLSRLLKMWFKKNPKLPEQFENPDFSVFKTGNGDFIAFKAVSPILKIDKKYWYKFLKQMKDELNGLISNCLSEIKEQAISEQDDINKLVKRGREIENSRANKGFLYPDEIMEYESIEVKTKMALEKVTNMQRILSLKGYWYIKSIHQEQQYLVVELLS